MNAPGFYETERALSEYLLFHYGAADQVLPWPNGPSNGLNYPARCVSECLDVGQLPAGARALDLGCAVGRSAFELARYCPEVLGIDYSRLFIGAACCLQEHGALEYAFVEEGCLTTRATAEVPAGIDRTRVRFECGDAEELPPDLGRFDVVLMANLVDRLPHPQRCLEQLPALVAREGQLILTTPCTWLEEYTPRAEWLGGFEQDGSAVRTPDRLRHLLEPAFVLTKTLDLPFVIREHARKYQWSVALATVWQRL